MARTAKVGTSNKRKRNRSTGLSVTQAGQEQPPVEDLVARNIGIPDDPKPPATYVVALDIGTTFSGAAISIKQGDDIQRYPIQNYYEDEVAGWVGEQIPTESWYPAPNTSQDSPIVSSSSATINATFGDRVCPRFLHGFEVQKMLGHPSCAEYGYRNNRRVCRMKLMFDPNMHDTTLDSTFEEINPTGLDMRTRRAYRNEAQAAKMRLNATAKLLSAEGRIKEQPDLLKDWLVPWLFHILREMTEKHEFTDSSPVTFAFCVPVCWKPESNAILSRIIVDALRRVQFGVSGHCDVPTVFMFNEAETAMTYIVEAAPVRITSNQFVIILDCGGGTIDGGEYQVSSGPPFRLEKEVNNPTGRCCGSSHSNEYFLHMAIADLKDEGYLIDRDYSSHMPIRTQIERYLMPKFEEVKKRFDLRSSKMDSYSFLLPGLRPTPGTRRRFDHYVLSYDDMLACFEEPMLAVWDVMVEQIMGTAGGKRRKRGSTSQNANSVIMTGGFSDSPALRSFLKGKLAQFNEQHGLAIELQWAPQNRSVLGTALGTLARAENVDSGPLRVPRLSIGLLRDHEHQGKDMYQVVKQFPELMPIEKQKKRRKLDPVVGRHYVEDVIEWIIKVGQGPLQRVHESDYYATEYYFWPEDDRWEQTEPVYVSGTCTESYWGVDHPKNKGKVTLLGNMQLDFTELKEKELIDIVTPEPGQGEPHYLVEVLLRCRIVDKDIKWEWRWPALKDVEPYCVRTQCFVAGFGTE